MFNTYTNNTQQINNNNNIISSNGKLCTICNLIINRNNYSTKQWNNKAKSRKCINCVNNIINNYNNNNNKNNIDTSGESPIMNIHGLSAIVLNTPSAINTRILANINNGSNNNHSTTLPNNLP